MTPSLTTRAWRTWLAWLPIPLIVVAILGVAHLYRPPANPPTWREVWEDGHGARYYADMATVRRARDAVSVVGWEFTPLRSDGGGLRLPIPRFERARESVTIDCATMQMTGGRTASVESPSLEVGQRIVSFTGGVNDHGPHAALARYLCTATERATEPR